MHPKLCKKSLFKEKGQNYTLYSTKNTFYVHRCDFK